MMDYIEQCSGLAISEKVFDLHQGKQEETKRVGHKAIQRQW
jgi:hypothetical protein